MKVRFTFEKGDRVEPEFVGRTFENSGPNNKSGNCCVCPFYVVGDEPKQYSACQMSCGCGCGSFVEVICEQQQV